MSALEPLLGALIFEYTPWLRRLANPWPSHHLNAEALKITFSRLGDRLQRTALEDTAIDLAGGVLWEIFNKHDLAGYLVGGQALFDKNGQFVRCDLQMGPATDESDAWKARSRRYSWKSASVRLVRNTRQAASKSRRGSSKLSAMPLVRSARWLPG